MTIHKPVWWKVTNSNQHHLSEAIANGDVSTVEVGRQDTKSEEGANVLVGTADALYMMIHWSYGGDLAMVGLSLQRR